MIEALSNVLECVDLFKTFHTQDSGEPTRVLRGLSCHVAPGEVVATVGLSGSGKTTLLRTISGLTSPDSGSILVDGHATKGPGPDRVLLFQEDTLLPWRRVLENVALGSSNSRGDRAIGEAGELLKRVGLGGRDRRWPRELSGGERRRAELVRSLAAQPRVLLLDEPFASLDAATRRSLYELVSAVWDERRQTVLFTTHDLFEAAMLADRILMLSLRTGTIVNEEEVSRSAVHLRAEAAAPLAEALYEQLEDTEPQRRNL